MTFKTTLTRRPQEEQERQISSRSGSQKGEQPRRGSGSSLECLDIYRTLVNSVHNHRGEGGKQRRGCEEAECLSYFSTEALELALRARKTEASQEFRRPEAVMGKPQHGDSAPWYSSPAWYR